MNEARHGTREDEQGNIHVVEWAVNDAESAKYVGLLELSDDNGYFEILHTAPIFGPSKAYDENDEAIPEIKTPERLLFGGACNIGFIESGYMDFEEDETLDEALQELNEELNVYYRDGASYCTRIVCNERM